MNKRAAVLIPGIFLLAVGCDRTQSGRAPPSPAAKATGEGTAGFTTPGPARFAPVTDPTKEGPKRDEAAPRAAPATNDTGPQPKEDKPAPPRAIKVAERLDTISMPIGGKTVTLFCDEKNQSWSRYAVSFNMNLPNAAELRKALLTGLAQDQKHRDEILFAPFTPKEKAPDPVEVTIGKGVPLSIAQAVLGELSKAPGMKLALSVTERDERFIPTTREVSIGVLTKSGKSAVTPEKLKSLLDPKLTHAEFLDRIRKDK